MRASSPTLLAISQALRQLASCPLHSQEVRLSNMTAAKAVSDAVRTSLGPKGMDKMVRRALLALAGGRIGC